MFQIPAIITDFIDDFSNNLYYGLIVILILSGMYFTIRTKFVQFRLFPAQIKAVTEKTDKNSVSSFQALMVSTASRVGTGNIIGVATALCLGGYGSVFWMWLIAIIGSASAFAESTLAQIFKKKGPDGCYGGPAYYIEAGIKKRWIAVVFSIFLILTYGFGFNMLASYNLQSTFSTYDFYNSKTTPWIIGLILAIIVGYCLIGGGKRIVTVTTFLVPFMGVAYILIAILITLMNFTAIPEILKRIFVEAFDFNAIFGGFTGSCIMYGIKRGLFSNEAGVGSAPNASASATVSHPVKQGLVQVLSVFIDTILVCSATAFMCLSSGIEPTKAYEGADYIQNAMTKNLGGFGPIFITISMILFAFTTLLGNIYYVDKCVPYLFKKVPTKKVQNLIYILLALVIFVGAGLSADLLWDIADITMGGMTLINIPVIMILGKYSIKALENYEKQKKSGKEPVFKANDIGIETELDYWN